MLLARFLAGGIRAASAIVYRWVPRRIASLLGAVIFAVLLVTVVNGTLVSATIGAIDRAQALVDVTARPRRHRADRGHKIGRSRLSDRVARSRPSRQAICHGGTEEGGDRGIHRSSGA